MAQIEWTPSLNMGVDHLDAQHRKIVESLNRLDACLDDDRDRPEVTQCLKEVESLLLGHFKDEERFMGEIGYPEAESHAQEHRACAIQIKKLDASLRDGADMADLLLDFVQTWFSEHFALADGVLFEHIRANRE